MQISDLLNNIQQRNPLTDLIKQTQPDLTKQLTDALHSPDPLKQLSKSIFDQLPPNMKTESNKAEVEIFSEKILLASYVVFDKSDQTISVYPGNEATAGPPQVFPAGNNTIVDSNGPWPAGDYPFSWHKPHPESGPKGKYGSNGNFIFEVPGHIGMGVHSGRADKGGPAYPTEGCIRTTDEGTEALSNINKEDPLQFIRVRD